MVNRYIRHGIVLCITLFLVIAIPARYETSSAQTAKQSALVHKSRVNGLAFGDAFHKYKETYLYTFYLMPQYEVQLVPGSGNIIFEERMNKDLQKSTHDALAYIRANADMLGIAKHTLRAYDIYIYIHDDGIEGSYTGTSAGVTIALGLISAFSGQPISSQYATTGEIDRDGNIFSIGGIASKIEAAWQNGASHIILPRANKKDTDRFPDCAKKLTFIWTDTIEEILDQIHFKKQYHSDTVFYTNSIVL